MEEARNQPQETPPAPPAPPARRVSRTVRNANAGPQLRPLLTGVGVVVVLVGGILLAGRYDRARHATPPPEVKPGRIQVESIEPSAPAAPAPAAPGAGPAGEAAAPPVHFYEVLSGGREDAPVGSQMALRALPLPPPPDGGAEAKAPTAGTPEPVAAPAREARAEAPAREPAPAAAPAPAPAKAPAPAAAPAGGPKPYSLQVGSFSQKDGAGELADRLKGKGFDAYLVSVDLGGKGTWWRVRVGRYATEYAAKWARLDLVKEGLSPIVVRDRTKR